MTTLFGYFDLGLRSLSAAQLGLHVAGDNISNIGTPGYARRRAVFESGFPVRVGGGLLDMGVDVARIRRFEDRFLQTSLERELGSRQHAEQRLRGLRDIESIYGTIENNGILGAYGAFADAFGELAAGPESLALRRTAVLAADGLARQIRDAYSRLQSQQRLEDRSIEDIVGEVNQLAGDLARLNKQIFQEEADGSTASPLRDRRQVVVERLVELTGGHATDGGDGKLAFALPGGPTVVTPEGALSLALSRRPDGLLAITGAGGIDVTNRLREGRLGAHLELRDSTITARQGELDRLAADLIGRANALTTGAFDLNGNAGLALFDPNPPPASGAARTIAINGALSGDPALLAISADGAPGNGAAAIGLAALRDTTVGALGGRTPVEFLSDALAVLGNDIVQADVNFDVSQGLVDSLLARREEISGVSLDEEALELVRFQRSYEAAARFIQVVNEITEIAVRLR